MNECEYLGQRDEGYGQSERHDLYCYYYLRWCPDCGKCEKHKTDESDES